MQKACWATAALISITHGAPILCRIHIAIKDMSLVKKHSQDAKCFQKSVCLSVPFGSVAEHSSGTHLTANLSGCCHHVSLWRATTGRGSLSTPEHTKWCFRCASWILICGWPHQAKGLTRNFHLNSILDGPQGATHCPKQG